MKFKQYSNYGLKLYLQSAGNPKSLIGLDIGTSFTGCAISCNNLKKSYFLKTINSSIKNKNLINLLTQIAQKNKSTAFIIGLPKAKIQYVSSSLKQMSQIIKQYMQNNSANDQNRECNQSQSQSNHQLNKKIMPFTYVDQSWSTKQSTQKLKEFQAQFAKWGHLHKQKQLVDGLSAMNILDRFLSYYNER